MSDLVVGTAAHVKEYVRRPLNLALLAVLPPLVVLGYGAAMQSFPAALVGTDSATAGQLSGAMFATAFLAGVVGLFQVISARQADRRLLLCGYSPTGLLTSRLVTVAGVSLLAAVISFAVLSTRVTPAAPLAALGALALASLLYALLGVLIGSVLPRELEGSILLVFLADMDDFMSSGMGNVNATVAKLFPLYHPHHLFAAAMLDGTVPAGHALSALRYAAVLAVITYVVYVRSNERGWSL